MSGRRRWIWWALVALIAVVGFTMRVWNLDFDQRQHLHPDERHWAMTSSTLDARPVPDRHGTVLGPVLDWLDGDRSPANPYVTNPGGGSNSFVYGPVTLATTRAAAGWLHDGAITGAQPANLIGHVIDGLGIPLLDDSGAPRFDTGYQIDLLGRLLGAIADSVTIVVIAIAGRRLGAIVDAGSRAPWVGLAAAGWQAFSVLAIQHAHFLGSEPALGLASALVVTALLYLDRSSSRRRALGYGVLVGAASGAVLAVKLSGAGLAAVPFIALGGLLVRHRRQADIVRLVAAAFGAVVAFRVLCPAAFEGLTMRPSSVFWDDQQRARAAAAADLPPAVQWADRPRLLDGVRWLTVYTVGPAAVAAGIAGSVLLWRRRRTAGWWPIAVIIAAWLVPFLFVFRSPVTSGRYFVPMLPALHLAAGFGVVSLLALATSRRAWWPRVGPGIAGALIAVGVLWGIAFTSGVYGDTNTRVAASHWIAANVPAGATLSLEGWDDGLPLSIPGIDVAAYEFEQLDLFGPDNLDKTEHLAEQLTRIDYVVESSPRVWGTVGRIPSRFPSTIAFFDGLDDGSLGFARVATFDTSPRLGPFVLDDADAEEAFSVYDHPEVRIWQRVEDLSRDELVTALDPIGAANALPVTWFNAYANGLLLTDEVTDELAEAGTYTDTFRGGPAWVHLAGWLIVIELIGLATFAIGRPWLRRLPDAGAGVADVLGLVALVVVVFVGVTWVGLPLRPVTIAAAVATWLVIGGWLGWRRRVELGDVWRRRWPIIVAAKASALVLFATALALRAADPDVWHPSRGGEKLFELEMLTAVLRSPTLPPYDAWFAGGSMNYYYAGYLLLAIPARLFGTNPTLALNLGIGVAALLASGAAFTAAGAVARWRDELTTSRRDSLNPGSTAAASTARSITIGLLAVGFVLVVPNLAVGREAIERLTGDGVYDWWGVSRVIPGAPSPTEFPAWSFLFGDLHPHVLDIAVLLSLLVAVVLLSGVVRRGTADRRSLWRPGVAGGVVGAVVGVVRATNTWDFPLALVLVVVAVVGPALAVARQRPDERRATWRAAVAAALGAVVVIVVVWSPFVTHMEVTDQGIQRAEGFTPLSSWFLQFGLFALVTLLLPLMVVIDRRPSRARSAAIVVAVAGAATALVTLVGSSRATLTVNVLLALVAAACAWRLRASAGPAARALVGAAVVAGIGWLMLAGIEVVMVVNDFSRMNTVFKGWYQAWVLLAVASAVIVGSLLLRPAEVGSRAGRWVVLAPRVVIVVALAAVVAFAALAIPVRLDDRISADGWSLDGEAWLDEESFRVHVIDPASGELTEVAPADDRPLIEWLRTNVDGVVPIAEAQGESYTLAGRMAAFTGLPTIIGWPYHQSQQRRNYGVSIDSRRRDLVDLYTSADEAVITSALQRNRIAYVVFGTTERAIASDDARDALVEHPCLDIPTDAEWGDLFIATVGQPCLIGRPGSVLPLPR